MQRSARRFVVALILVLVGVATTLANTRYNYHLTSISEYFKNNVLEIQFNPWISGGNDWLIIFTKFKQLSHAVKLVLPNGKEIVCGIQVQGVYYANPIGLRILPLSQTDKEFLNKLDSNYSAVSVSGGLYTHCVGDKNIDYNSIFWYVKWYSSKFSLKNSLYVGYKVSLTNIDLSNFVNAVGYVWWTKFVGWIYDSVAGAGFMGGMFTGAQIQYAKAVLSRMMDLSDKPIDKNLALVGDKLKVLNTSYEISTNNVLINIIGNILVNWVAWLSNYQNNISDAFSFILPDRSKADITKANYRKYYKDILSRLGGRGKVLLLKSKLYTPNLVINRIRKNVASLCRGRWRYQPDSNSNINCIDAQNTTVNIDLSQYSNGSYIIVKNWNLMLNGSVNSNFHYNIFVDQWKLILSNNLVAYNNSAYWEAVVLKGNYVVNGIIEGNWPGGVFEHQLIIKGRLLSLNTLAVPTQKRIALVKNIVRDSSIGANNINLNDIFSWQLEIDGKWTDGRLPYEKYPGQALIIEGLRYQSWLFK